MLGDLPPDLGGVAAALLPAPQDVVLVGAMALTFFVKCLLRGGASKARYFPTVWRCIPSSLATWAFFMPFFERAWMDPKSFRVCSFVRSFEHLRSRRRFVSR